MINIQRNTNSLEFLIIIDFSFSGAFCLTTSVKYPIECFNISNCKVLCG